jgi:hypothetical protein
MVLQKAWGICNTYQHGNILADVSEFASKRRGANGIIDARDGMVMCTDVYSTWTLL